MIVKVMMAEWKMARAPQRLKTLGLGSCVAVILHDPLLKTAAMAHVMLPYAKMAKSSTTQKGKYADTAIAEMLQALQKNGVKLPRLDARLVGGAHMFNFQSRSHRLDSIGARNVEACVKTLDHYRIPIMVQETGGSSGRTVEFFCEDGTMTIKTVNQGVKTFK